MKKLSLLLVVLLAAGSAGLYGQMAIGTNFSVSGDATATAGYNLDNDRFGFTNEANANIKIVFEEMKDEKVVHDRRARPQTDGRQQREGRYVRLGRLDRVEGLPDHHR